MISVYLFAAVLAVLAVCAVVASVREGEPTDPETEGAPPGERREAAVEALREIEFEYRTGKLDEEDYRELRERYAAAAVRARREEEETGERGTAAGTGPGESGGPEGQLTAPEDAPGASAPDPEAELAGSCPSCGTPARPGARYCARCGEPLSGAGRERSDES